MSPTSSDTQASATLLVVADRGMGKRTAVDDYRKQRRGGKGLIGRAGQSDDRDCVEPAEDLLERPGDRSGAVRRPADAVEADRELDHSVRHRRRRQREETRKPAGSRQGSLFESETPTVSVPAPPAHSLGDKNIENTPHEYHVARTP